MSAPVMSNAGRYGVSSATVLRGAWMITSGWSGRAPSASCSARTSPAGRIQSSPRKGLRGSSTPFQARAPGGP